MNVVVDGNMDGRLLGFGKFREAGEGRIVVCMCCGDCGGMYTDPDDDILWCGEFLAGIMSAA